MFFAVLHVSLGFFGKGFSGSLVPDLLPVLFVLGFGVDKVEVGVFGAGQASLSLFEPGGRALLNASDEGKKSGMFADRVIIIVKDYVLHVCFVLSFFFRLP